MLKGLHVRQVLCRRWKVVERVLLYRSHKAESANGESPGPFLRWQVLSGRWGKSVEGVLIYGTREAVSSKRVGPGQSKHTAGAFWKEE